MVIQQPNGWGKTEGRKRLPSSSPTLLLSLYRFMYSLTGSLLLSWLIPTLIAIFCYLSPFADIMSILLVSKSKKKFKNFTKLQKKMKHFLVLEFFVSSPPHTHTLNFIRQFSFSFYLPHSLIFNSFLLQRGIIPSFFIQVVHIITEISPLFKHNIHSFSLSTIYLSVSYSFPLCDISNCVVLLGMCRVCGKIFRNLLDFLIFFSNWLSRIPFSTAIRRYIKNKIGLPSSSIYVECLFDALLLFSELNAWVRDS